ncbi:MAG: CapA family protein [Anaerolineaceae bacterium]
MLRQYSTVERILAMAAVVFICGAACQPLVSPPLQSMLNPSATPDENDGFLSVLIHTPTPVNTPVLNLPATSTPIPSQPDPSIQSPEESETPTLYEQSAICMAIEQSLPAIILDNLRNQGVRNCKPSDDVEAQVGFGKKNLVSNWIFALAAPFETVIDEVSSAKLMGFWTDDTSAPFDELIMDRSTMQAIRSLWGAPKGKVSVHPAAELLDLAWENIDVWAILPFESLLPRWKVIALEGQTPLSKQFDPDNYLLNVPISVWAEGSTQLSSYANSVLAALPASNRDPQKLATVVVTGVTALARATAYDMEISGVTKPAEEVGDILRDADLLHISNEVPFYQDCPYPDPYGGGALRFCSADYYLELLQVIGTDVVDLTGDHLLDYGQEALLHTLAIYREQGWPFFGAGMNLREAEQATTFEINGNWIAFVGCNAKPLSYLAATDGSAGVFHCGVERMASSIRQLSAEGFNPIVTFQHDEVYSWDPTPRMIEDFNAAAEAGAVIVSGSQGHQPQTIAFVGDDRFIHYGLGNLFFDQFGLSTDTDKAFIDRHIFYNNHYIGTELLTVKFTDYSTPRWMTNSERIAMLNQLFVSSED